ncbi:MAG: ATP-binding cassette domain-containing protein, partial [Sulfurimonadaceae bacterium]
MNPVLEIEGLNFGYTPDKMLYEDFSLTLQRGEIKAVVGASGSGKSTLFEIILGNLRPFSGELKSSRVSQVFQDPYTSFHPAYSIINQIKDVAPLEGLGLYLEEMGMERSLLEKQPHELSGGQLQRCSIV